ncbi:hypothetical protein [Echinicola rosea]|uniref:Uncharacterized protein n=1 Tax=Echinicola rosea TaxID=1807691 RepID=A0ABQ1VAT7_9BACT|nr:hypothetical protein [Echinicola rosea]GGF44102.1 hypothetical protein GCM10011339_35740 [Echinicola rosea]
MGIAIAQGGNKIWRAKVKRICNDLQSWMDGCPPKQQYRLMILLMALGTIGFGAIALSSVGSHQAILNPMPSSELPVLPAYRDSIDVEPFKPIIDDERTQ